MFLLWLLVAVLLVAICWLLWVPIRLEINTWKSLYKVGWGYILALQWLPEQGLDVLEVRLFFWKKRFSLSEIAEKRVQKRPAVIPKRRSGQSKKSKDRFAAWRMMKKIVRTFEVRQCQVWMDTGDFLWNAWLFPICWLLRGEKNVSVWVNFQGRNECLLLVENRLGRVLWVLISSLNK